MPLFQQILLVRQDAAVLDDEYLVSYLFLLLAFNSKLSLETTVVVFSTLQSKFVI